MTPTSAPSAPYESDALAADIRERGFALVPRALDPQALASLQAAYARQIELAERQVVARSHDRHPEGWLEIARLFECDPVFEVLMDPPLALDLAVRIIGPDIELASSGELDHKYPGTEASFCGWHTDFIWIPRLTYPRQVFWLACYYFIADVSEDMGPLVVLPGSHRYDGPPGPQHNTVLGHGKMLGGAVAVTGRAGDAVFFNNEIWHMSPPNRSARARALLKVHYKPSWMKQWGGARQTTQEYALRGTSPVRQQLLGCYQYDKVPWQYGERASDDRYPVVQYLRGLTSDAAAEKAL